MLKCYKEESINLIIYKFHQLKFPFFLKKLPLFDHNFPLFPIIKEIRNTIPVNVVFLYEFLHTRVVNSFPLPV